MLSFPLRTDFCISSFAWAVAADLSLLLLSLPSCLLLSKILPFHHLCKCAQIMIFLAVASSTLLSASWHHSAWLLTLSPVLSAPMCAVCIACSQPRSSATSTSSSCDKAARFNPLTSGPPASSYIAISNSHSMILWLDPVVWLMSRIIHYGTGQWARVRAMMDSPMVWYHVQ